MRKQNKIFLTGATGFIGSHVLQQAELQKIAIKAHRRSPNSFPKIKLVSQPEWIDTPLDHLAPEHFASCDTLIHLASPGVSPQKATADELIYWNVVAFHKLLENATQGGVKRFILTGTFAEYGLAANQYDCIPSSCELLPTTDYAASKAAAWAIAHAFAVQKNVELCMLRIFSAYGEGQNEDNFWPSLRKAALAGEDFEMTAGEQVRDYIHVSDVARKTLKAATTSELQRGNPAQFNLASGNPTTMRKFAEKYWSEWQATGKLLVGKLPYRHNEVMKFRSNRSSIFE